MAIKINFDTAHNPEEPTFVLAKKNGDKLGKIDACEIEVVDNLNDASEISFAVYKYVNGIKNYLWDDIVNFRLVYCVEWDKWFEITTEIDESSEIKKTVSGTLLGQAELSQIMLYDIQINTEDDIARDAYVVPTVLYRENGELTDFEKKMASEVLKKDVTYLDDYKSASLLDRIIEKCPHYSIAHVDKTIAHIQRTFEFSDTSIYDAFQDIAEEIGCLFVFHSNSDKDGNIQRLISVYDLESNCLDCGKRGEFTMICPECFSKNVDEGYGDDTGIFVTSDELAESIQLSTDTGKVKNCFKLEAGDDLMTATVRNCNPNGSDYIWYITDATKKDMSYGLVTKIAEYDEIYADYNSKKDYRADLNPEFVSKYNELINKYKAHFESDEDLKYGKDSEGLMLIPDSIVGYSKLMEIYYDTVDFALYLESGLMPIPTLEDTNAKTEAAKLTAGNLSPIASTDLNNLSSFTADNLVSSMAKAIIDNRYKIKVKSSSLDGATWTGILTVTNFSDEEDTEDTAPITITINDDYETFVRQKIEKELAKGDTEDYSIASLFDKDLESFKKTLKNYSLKRIESFHDACQSSIDILVQQGIADKDGNNTWSTNEEGRNLYDDLYTPYLDKLRATEEEMNLRQKEVETIKGVYDENDNLVERGIQNYIEDVISSVQDTLNFERYIGKDLWLEMCSFRREDKYSNDNYISEGLDNAKIIEKAIEFLEEANKEIYKSAELQHSISADLNNLLVIDKFKPLVNDFKVGNWIRIMVDDELFKLRLIEYGIDYDNIEKLPVEFSDTMNVASTAKKIQGILDQASSMATSYESVKKQAEQGKDSNEKLSGWVNDGLSLTNMKIVNSADNQNVIWDSHGILCREYSPITETYEDEQLKIINRGLYVTNDNWETAKAGIGNFTFYNPSTKKEESAYGVIADTLVGNLILSEKVGIYNKNNSITLDDKGISITVEDDVDYTKTVFNIQKRLSDDTIKKLMYVDSNGNLVLNGNLKVENAFGNTDTTLEDLGNSSIANNYLNYSDGVLKVGKSDSGYIDISDSNMIIYNNNSDDLINIGADGIRLNNGMKFISAGIEGVFLSGAPFSVSANMGVNESYKRVSIKASDMRSSSQYGNWNIDNSWVPLGVIKLTTNHVSVVKISGWNLNPSAKDDGIGIEVFITRNGSVGDGSDLNSALSCNVNLQILWVKCSYNYIPDEINDVSTNIEE